MGFGRFGDSETDFFEGFGGEFGEFGGGDRFFTVVVGQHEIAILAVIDGDGIFRGIFVIAGLPSGGVFNAEVTDGEGLEVFLLGVCIFGILAGLLVVGLGFGFIFGDEEGANDENDSSDCD